jgi:hypothetical protein
MTKLANPVPLFLDTRGALMDGGHIYVGAVNSDPQARPITVYWDFAQTQPAEQPLRTIGGLIVNGVVPASVFFPQGDYAMRVTDQNDTLVFYSPSIYASASFQPLDTDLSAIAALGTTPYGRSLLTLANQAALVAATGLNAGLPLTGGTMTGDILRQGAGGYVYTTTGTGAKIYPPLPVGSANPATGPLSLQGFY